jgi:uncharacterized transporter YbjL
MPQDVRVFITRIRRAGGIIEATPDTVVHEGDVVAVAARGAVLVKRGSVIGPEVDDNELLDFPIEIFDVVVTNKSVQGRTLQDIALSRAGRVDVLKMNPVMVLGACSGAGTMTAALRAIQDESQSKLPAIGYTVPYAVGNILLTAWGPVIVALLSAGR